VGYVTAFVTHAVKLGLRDGRPPIERRLSALFVEALVDAGLLQVGAGFCVQGLGFRVQGLWFRVQGLGRRRGVGSGVQGLRV
jgi:hypothetical protein